MSNNQSQKKYFKDDDYQQNVDYRSFFVLLKYARPFWKSFGFAIILVLVSASLAIVSARIMGLLVEDGLVAKNSSYSWQLAACILVLEFFSIGFIWQGRKRLARASTNYIFHLRKIIFQHIHALPISYYDHQPQGRTVTRMTHDVEGMEEFFSLSMGRMLHSLIVFITACAAMLFTNFNLGWMLILAMTPAVLTTYVCRGPIRELNRKMSIYNSACNAKLSEFIKGLPVIRSFGLEKWSMDEYRDTVNKHQTSLLNANAFYAWTRPLTNFMCYFPLIGLIWWGGRGVIEGTLGIGVLVAFIRYCERFSFPLVALTREIHVIQQAFTSAERVTAFLKAETETQELGKDGEFKPDSLKGVIEFADVHMAYEANNPVLKGVNFKIPSGEKVGIVGTTGSGKTTTVSLLARLYEFQKGQIKIDGHDIRSFNRNALRDQLGFVSQDVILFRGSLRENLTCEAEISDQAIKEACAKTGLGQVMQKNSLSLESEILEGGTNLSIGERQLVSLTRVLLKNPGILILDEATANIDPEYEKIIQTAVDTIMENRTCLIIAHRLNTLKSCDRIFVFKEGILAESGAHHELLARKGHYQALYQTSLGQSVENTSSTNPVL